MRSFLSILVLLAMCSQSPAEDAEYRFFWVVRDGLSTPGQVDELLNRAAGAGANGVLVQVVGRGEAYYRSDILPPAEFSGFDDPLEYLIMKAGPLGLEVHAWVNAFLVWSSPMEPSSPDHIYNTHPEWFTGHVNGRSSRSFAPAAAEAAGLVGATLSPAYPGVRKYIADIASEIAMNYDVAGIHLDYIRYPNSSFGYSPGEVELYYLETCLQPEDDRPAWENWKRQQVTATVETVRTVLRGSDPQTVLTCAVMADPHTARGEFACDWRYWLSQGLIDLAFPMAYTSDRERAMELASAITFEYPEKIVYGIGLWNQTAENALPAAERALSLGARGICVFSLNSLTPRDGEVLRSRWGTGPMPDHGVSPAMFNRVVAP